MKFQLTSEFTSETSLVKALLQEKFHLLADCWPTVFWGRCSSLSPNIVLQFHGQGRESPIVFKATTEEKIIMEREWKVLFCDIVNALRHIHDCGFSHNDLKNNNVVLEIWKGFLPNLVIVDFGKSKLAVKAKKPRAKAKCAYPIKNFT